MALGAVVALGFFALLSEERVRTTGGFGAGGGFATMGLPDAVRPLEIRRIALTGGLLEAGADRGAGVGTGKGREAGGGDGVGATGICIVMDVEVAIPITSRRLTSSYVERWMAGTDAEGLESAELRLLGSPFIRLRMSCVAAENWGV